MEQELSPPFTILAPLITLTLPATDEEKTRLGGESEQNFIRLEQTLGVKLLTRNPGITIHEKYHHNMP